MCCLDDVVMERTMKKERKDGTDVVVVLFVMMFVVWSWKCVVFWFVDWLVL